MKQNKQLKPAGNTKDKKKQPKAGGGVQDVQIKPDGTKPYYGKIFNPGGR
jgi:hypothetical protein